MANTKSTSTLTLIVSAEDETPAALRPGEIQPHGFGKWARRKVTATTDVSLDDVKSQLDKVQGELDPLLDNLPEPKGGGFQLHEVEVGLFITAEGSIGVATIGGEISLTLTFARED